MGAIIITAWKVSKYEAFSGLYFPVVSANTGKYGPEKSPYLNTSENTTFLRLNNESNWHNNPICNIWNYSLILFENAKWKKDFYS